LEFLWKKSPKNAVIRRKTSNKWYAVILTISKRKLNLDTDEIIEVSDGECILLTGESGSGKSSIINSE